MRHAVETIAIVAAGLWAFYVFIYDGYNVWGLRYGSRAVISDQHGRFEQLYRDAIPPRSQTLIESFAELRGAAVGGNPGNHIVIEPG